MSSSDRRTGLITRVDLTLLIADHLVMDMLAPLTVTKDQFRDALGCFATGVTIVAGLDEIESPVGCTVSSFTTLSLEPPLVLFSLMKSKNSARHFTPGKPFVINILDCRQVALSKRFARSDNDKWEGVPIETWATGVPVIIGAIASIEGVVSANHEGGDHVIIVGRVVSVRAKPKSPFVNPLLHFRGHYAVMNTKRNPG